MLWGGRGRRVGLTDQRTIVDTDPQCVSPVLTEVLCLHFGDRLHHQGWQDPLRVFDALDGVEPNLVDLLLQSRAVLEGSGRVGFSEATGVAGVELDCEVGQRGDAQGAEEGGDGGEFVENWGVDDGLRIFVVVGGEVIALCHAAVLTQGYALRRKDRRRLARGTNRPVHRQTPGSALHQDLSADCWQNC